MYGTLEEQTQDQIRPEKAWCMESSTPPAATGLEAQMESLLTCAGVEDSHCVDV